jgi:hypothetical protein
MRSLLALLVISVSLVLGVVGAATAYSPRTSLPASAFQVEGGYATLAQPAGLRDAPPIAPAGAQVTPETLQLLDAAKVERVRVKEFSIARWSESWMFLVGCVGLGIGAGIIRFGRATSAGTADSPASGTALARPPQQALAQLRSDVDALIADRVHQPDPGARMRAILDRVSVFQRTTMPEFVEGRPTLIARGGLGFYSSVMTPYAAAERALNRAWSAAADAHLPEAEESLDTAVVRLQEAAAKLGDDPRTQG